MPLKLKLIFFVLLQSLMAMKALCQFNERIRTGRPGQAIGGFAVGKKVVQFQQGIEYFSSYTNGYNQQRYLSNNVIRFGIMENLEISTLIDYQFEKRKTDSLKWFLNGVSNFQLGFRVHLNDQKKWIPATGFQFRLRMPDISEDYKVRNLAPVVIFVATWSLPHETLLSANWIIEYDGNSPVATGKYIINYSFPLSGKWSGFIENYGQLRGTKFQTRFDGGIAVLVNNNIQFDLSAGVGQNQEIRDFFAGVGISYRFINFRKNSNK